MKILNAALFLILALSVANADTTLLNQSLTETYSNASPGTKNLGALTMLGTSTLTLVSTATSTVSDSLVSFQLTGTTGGLDTIDVVNNGSGHFTFSLGGLNGRATGSIINFETSNTGGGTVTLATSSRIGNGAGGDGKGNDLSVWAFYDGNNWAATASATGGVLGSGASEYDDGGHDTSATNLTSWAGNTVASGFQDYTDDTATTYSGALTNNAEKHGLRFANSAGAAINLGTFTLSDAGLLDAQGAGAVTISGGILTAQGLTNELIINQNNTANTMTISSSITGTSSALTKSGVGTLILTGSNNYAGTTYIDAGTLLNDGTLSNSTGSMLLYQGAAFGGSGISVQKLIAEGATSVISPGDPGRIGTLFLNTSLTAASGLTMDFKLDGEGTIAGFDNDELNVLGALNLNGHVVVNITALDSLMTGTPYTLISGLGDWSGSSPSSFTFDLPTGYKLDSSYGTGGYDFDRIGDTFSVQFEALPEAPTYMMMAAGLGILAVLIRRKSPLFVGLR